jgi:hypothetical protein
VSVSTCAPFVHYATLENYRKLGEICQIHDNSMDKVDAAMPGTDFESNFLVH